MNVGEMLTYLQELVDVDPEMSEATVKIVSQPNYPLVNTVQHLKVKTSNGQEIEEVSNMLADLKGDELNEAQEELTRLIEEDVTTVYIVEGSWDSYASRDMWDQDE